MCVYLISYAHLVPEINPLERGTLSSHSVVRENHSGCGWGHHQPITLPDDQYFAPKTM